MFTLSPHISNKSSLEPPRGVLNSKKDGLHIKFEVPLKEKAYFNDGFEKEFQNWGLWEYDVVEVFLTREPAGLPYLELQVSPLNQKFALLVEEPREKTKYPEIMPFKSAVRLLTTKWVAELIVPWSSLPGKDSFVRGNLHAVLGEERNHFSLTLNDDEAPDFHRPDLFKFLGDAR